ncbi:hypothetical protein [Microbacterium sp. SLBN-146]|uniref:hypothetical protein n=1 Tax=Microbacterium sp. SLBN-146 TaxID=2768457 RepID=UPI001154A073|nr:hypothetical protein [Microbacterium sp. SLBN-146]TQJ31685.1 hypothetical protein FBY39_2166 [Microbacterium sp. SLBN-146]
MDGRARIAFSGLAAFAVTATVVATVVTTNAAAFADAPGTAIDAAVVDVNATAKPTAMRPSEVITDLTDAAPAAPAAAPTTAPAPVDVPAETLVAPAPAVVVSTLPAAASPEPAVEPEAELSLRDALASDDPEALYVWAAAHGWSRERADRFLSTRPGARDGERRNDETRHDDHSEHRDNDQRGRFAAPSPPVQTGSPAVTESPQRGDGTKRDRSPGSPDHRD